MTTRVLLVEDEPIARRHLRELLGEFEWMTCVGEAGDGRTALELIDSLRPDLVFLDIELPELSGLEVLRRMTHDPDIVITTAYDRYAVAAFELEAVDYLLKPFGPERLRKTAERLLRTASASGDAPAPAGAAARARDVLEQLADGSRPTRLFVRDRGRVVHVPIGEIERLEAQDDYVAVITRGRRYLVYLGMAEFEERLDPRSFVRIHRSHIVNLDYVAAFATHDPTRLEVQMRDGTRLLASRTRSKTLHHLRRPLTTRSEKKKIIGRGQALLQILVEPVESDDRANDGDRVAGVSTYDDSGENGGAANDHQLRALIVVLAGRIRRGRFRLDVLHRHARRFNRRAGWCGRRLCDGGRYRCRSRRRECRVLRAQRSDDQRNRAEREKNRTIDA